MISERERYPGRATFLEAFHNVTYFLGALDEARAAVAQ
jgi:hypothetical protein